MKVQYNGKFDFCAYQIARTIKTGEIVDVDPEYAAQLMSRVEPGEPPKFLPVTGDNIKSDEQVQVTPIVGQKTISANTEKK